MERYIRPTIFSIDKEIHVLGQAMSDWSTRSLEFWLESSTLEAIRFWSSFTLTICICSWVVLLLVFGCIGLILISYYTVLHYRISIICLFSQFVFSLCSAYTIFLHYRYFHYLFLAIAFLNILNFFSINRY